MFFVLYPTWLICTKASIASYKNILRPMLLKVENMDWPSILYAMFNLRKHKL
jgi:hypothetical protein